METIFVWLLLIIGGYLLGSLLPCEWIAKHFCKKNIRKLSKDGNPGAANVFWQCGWKMGALGLILDILKGFIPVFVAVSLFGVQDIWLVFVMMAPVLGHAFPIFHGFEGGKCISTIFGVLSGLILYTQIWIVLGLLFLCFIYVFKIPNGNRRALTVFSIFSVLSILIELRVGQPVIAVGCVAISLIAICKHSPLFTECPAKHKKGSQAKR